MAGPPPFLPPPASRNGADSGGTARPSDEQPDHAPSGSPPPRRWRIVVVLIELLAVAGFVGAIIAWSRHNQTLGMLALGTALAANLILWAWARTFARRATTRQHGAGRGRS